jgi:cytochrome P450/nitrite reductase/ring-hydroxylating ferredoxin subunit
MSSGAFSAVGRSGDFSGAGPFVANAGGTDVVIVRTPRGLKAYEGRCPHQGALLGEGEIDGATLVCRNHRWRFDTETGKREGGPQCLRACPLREKDGSVELDARGLAAVAARKATRTIRDLPSPRSLPFIGSAHLINRRAMHLDIERWARELGTPFTYKFGPFPVVAFADVDTMLPALRERPETFRRATVEPIFRELGVNGVFSAEGAKWRPQRRLSMEALSHRHLRGFYPTLAAVADRLRRRWLRAAGRREVVDLCEELKRFTVDVTSQLTLGQDLNTLEQEGGIIQDKLALVIQTTSKRLLSVVPTWRFLRMPSDRRVDRTLEELRGWIGGLVSDARARLATDPDRAARPANFLEAMVTAHDDEGKPFDDDTIFANAMTMLLAGEDTTAYSIAWAVHHLVDSPADVGALRKEADALIGDAMVPSSIDAANRLVYAGAVANEAMRLRPVAPSLFLQANVDTVVSDVAIPKGTIVALLVRPPAIDPAHFGDPQVFRPARWIDPTATGGAHEPGASQPFGSGPRICPGRTLALLEMRLVLATLYKSFDVERVGKAEDVAELLQFTMSPTNLTVRFRERAAAVRDSSTTTARA